MRTLLGAGLLMGACVLITPIEGAAADCCLEPGYTVLKDFSLPAAGKCENYRGFTTNSYPYCIPTSRHRRQSATAIQSAMLKRRAPRRPSRFLDMPNGNIHGGSRRGVGGVDPD